jgi:hypothetical protein
MTVDSTQVQQDAKKIMDKFMNVMKDIEVEEDFILKRDNCFREEGEGLESNPEFKRRFLANAPQTHGDAIVANKGAWEE